MCHNFDWPISRYRTVLQCGFTLPALYRTWCWTFQCQLLLLSLVIAFYYFFNVFFSFFLFSFNKIFLSYPLIYYFKFCFSHWTAVTFIYLNDRSHTRQSSKTQLEMHLTCNFICIRVTSTENIPIAQRTTSDWPHNNSISQLCERNSAQRFQRTNNNAILIDLWISLFVGAPVDAVDGNSVL